MDVHVHGKCNVCGNYLYSPLEFERQLCLKCIRKMGFTNQPGSGAAMDDAEPDKQKPEPGKQKVCKTCGNQPDNGMLFSNGECFQCFSKDSKSTKVRIECPKCKHVFEPDNDALKGVAAGAGGALGGWLGSSIGVAAFGSAMSGLLPLALIGAGAAWILSDKAVTCPKCKHSFVK